MVSKYVPLVIIVIVFETLVDYIRTKSMKIALITFFEMSVISAVLLGYVQLLVHAFYPERQFGGPFPWLMGLLLFFGSVLFLLAFIVFRARHPFITKIDDGVVVQSGFLTIFRFKEVKRFEETRSGLSAHLVGGRVKKARLLGPHKHENIETIKRLMS